MDISEQQLDGVWLVAASGRIDSNSAPQLEAVLPDRVQQHEATIMDLAGVAYVSSAGLRVFLKGMKAAKAGGHRLVLTGLSPAATLHRVRALKESGVIRIIRAQVDPALAGFPLQVWVTATLTRHDPRSSAVFEDHVRAVPQILAADNLASVIGIGVGTVLRYVGYKVFVFVDHAPEALLEVDGEVSGGADAP